MGLYSKAQKLIDLRSGQRSPFLDLTSEETSPSQPKERTIHDPVKINSLVEKISAQVEPQSSFDIICMSLDDFIAGLDPSPTTAQRRSLNGEIKNHINSIIENIAHAHFFDGSYVIIVIPIADSIDSELFVHQIFISLKKAFHGKADMQVSVLHAIMKNNPNDGTDVRNLVEQIV
jgi:hypothetical protein